MDELERTGGGAVMAAGSAGAVAPDLEIAQEPEFEPAHRGEPRTVSRSL